MPIHPLNIGRLLSGGIIANYVCTSKCRHCLYLCGPRREKGYLTPQSAARVFDKIKSLGCRSVHIGGGEPMLDAGGLEALLREAGAARVAVEYVETNSSWYKGDASADAVLSCLSAAGLHTLLVSISPFHNEYIPLARIRGVIAACRRNGLGVFPWMQDLLPDLAGFEETKKHGLDEYTERYGADYVGELPLRYGVRLNGRAMLTYRNLYPLRPLKDVLEESGPCTQLADTSHFHIDLYENYVPGLCTGFTIALDDLGRPLDGEKYRMLLSVYARGVKALLAFAESEFGFIPEPRYLNKCHLCYEIRRFVVADKGHDAAELGPAGFYTTD